VSLAVEYVVVVVRPRRNTSDLVILLCECVTLDQGGRERRVSENWEEEESVRVG
jgi:hypothetical protein